MGMHDKQSRKQRRRQKRASRLKKTLLWSGCVAIACVCMGTTVTNIARHGEVGAPTIQGYISHAVADVGKAMTRKSAPQNVLLIANNARDAADPLSLGSAAGQADIIMVAHLNPHAHGITLISVPRDTLIAMPNWHVPIPKIKTAFTVGLQQSRTQGPKLEMQYVSRLTGLPIHSYVVTNFKGFVDAIDAIGGVPVRVEARIYDPYYSGANLRPGQQTLNGAQALAFVRVRQNQAGNHYRVNDFQRQQAEMQMLQSLKHRLLNSSTNPVQMMHLIKTWRKDVATNLGTSELVALATQVSSSTVTTLQLGSIRDSMNLASAPLRGVNVQNYLTGAYYDVLDPKDVIRTLSTFGAKPPDLGLPPMPSPAQVHVLVYGTKNAVQRLTQAGFQVTYAGSSRVKRTSVYFPRGQMPSGWAVARALGSSNAWVAPSRYGSQQVVVFAT